MSEATRVCRRIFILYFILTCRFAYFAFALQVKRILKMDPDLKQVSKESLALITYATQLFTAYTAQQSYSISTIQNRRKLLPRDLLDACGTREAMAFLREDIRDFVQKVEKEVLVGQKRKNENVEVGAGQAVQQQQFKNFFQSNI